MGDPIKENRDYMKIGDAARFLGVNRRTIYRWICSGTLSASKVGGLYFICKSDLEARLKSPLGLLTEKDSLLSESNLVKCGSCFRLITSDQQVGEVCTEPGCLELICVSCVDVQVCYCAKHSPTKAQFLLEAKQSLQRGDIAFIVEASNARLQERNFLNRIESRLTKITTLIHPLTRDILQIDSWSNLLEHHDARAEVMQLLNRVTLDSSTLGQHPMNAGFVARLPVSVKQRGSEKAPPPIEILVQVQSRMDQILRKGFDTQPLDLELLLSLILPLEERSRAQQTFSLVLLASITGWDSSARQAVLGDAGKLPFVSTWLLIYLFDLRSGELLYNRQDERMGAYAEIFVPLLQAEEVMEASRAVEKEIRYYDSLTLIYARQVLPYSENLLKKAFEYLVETGSYTLMNLPELGLAIVRHSRSD